MHETGREEGFMTTKGVREYMCTFFSVADVKEPFFAFSELSMFGYDAFNLRDAIHDTQPHIKYRNSLTHTPQASEYSA
jgi:hypothetical protein